MMQAMMSGAPAQTPFLSSTLHNLLLTSQMTNHQCQQQNHTHDSLAGWHCIVSWGSWLHDSKATSEASRGTRRAQKNSSGAVASSAATSECSVLQAEATSLLVMASEPFNRIPRLSIGLGPTLWVILLGVAQVTWAELSDCALLAALGSAHDCG